jgi:hypothetical protein
MCMPDGIEIEEKIFTTLMIGSGPIPYVRSLEREEKVGILKYWVVDVKKYMNF